MACTKCSAGSGEGASQVLICGFAPFHVLNVPPWTVSNSSGDAAAVHRVCIQQCFWELVCAESRTTSSSNLGGGEPIDKLLCIDSAFLHTYTHTNMNTNTLAHRLSQEIVRRKWCMGNFMLLFVMIQGRMWQHWRTTFLFPSLKKINNKVLARWLSRWEPLLSGPSDWVQSLGTSR